MSQVVITGVSSGIGNALAMAYLAEGHTVYGISRTAPSNLSSFEHFHFCAMDLSEIESIEPNLRRFLLEEQQVRSVDYLYLHAGQFSRRIAAMRSTPQSELDYLMRLNVWSNKAILDLLLNNDVAVNACMLSASIAGVRARAGNNGYAMSKAALLMLAKLYALENPDVFFAVLGLCLVDTPMTRKAATLPVEDGFAEVKMLLERAALPGYTVAADQRATQMRTLLEGRATAALKSGDFQEARSL